MNDSRTNAEIEKERLEVPDQGRMEELAEHFDRTDGGDPVEFEEVEDVVVERSPEPARISVRVPAGDLAALRQ